MNLSIVVPCYNEEEILPIAAERLDALLLALQDKGKIGPQSAIHFVDDGSRDRTWAIIEELSARNPRIKGIKLSRNRGHQNALIAGLFMAEGDAVVSIDADLQDDENVIEDMIDRCNDGFDMVFGVRSDRSADTLFKRGTAHGYYRLLSMMGVEVVHDHADFRLMTRAAIEALQEYSEVNLYLRGIIPLLGFNTATVSYKRCERVAGESKYPLSKMLALSLQGITSFSVVPIRIIAALGLFISLMSLATGLWALALKIFTTHTLPGWTSIVVPMSFLGGLQLLSLGVIGEYLGKVYLETKRRPRYTVEKTTPVPQRMVRPAIAEAPVARERSVA